MRYAAVGFDLLTALLDTWSLWSDVAGETALGLRWHASSQALLVQESPHHIYLTRR